MSKRTKVQDGLQKTTEGSIPHESGKKQMTRPIEELLHELQAHQTELEKQNEALRQSQIELEKFREHYADFYDFAPVGLLTFNPDATIEEINLTGAKLLVADRGELLHNRFAPFVVADDKDRWAQHFQNVLERDEAQSCELKLQRHDGSQFYTRLVCQRLKHEGKPRTVRVVLTDVTERKHAEEAVRAQEEFFRMIAENVEDFLAVLDLEGRRLYNSPSYGKIFGNVDGLMGTDSFAEIHPDDLERVKQAFNETIQTGRSHRLNFRFVLPDGDIHYMESCGGLIRNSQGQALRVVVVSRDISERLKEEDKIRNLAFYDELTELPNRRLLNDRLEQSMAASKRSGRYGALMFLDLDNFKPLNDTYGHSVGDLLLKEVAYRITNRIREMDTVARIGGDEFIVLLSELDEDREKSIERSRKVADKIRADLADPYELKFQQQDKTEKTVEHFCTASLGVVLFRNHEHNAEELIKMADLAMYQAKDKGRNSIRFDESNA